MTREALDKRSQYEKRRRNRLAKSFEALEAVLLQAGVANSRLKSQADIATEATNLLKELLEDKGTSESTPDSRSPRLEEGRLLGRRRAIFDASSPTLGSSLDNTYPQRPLV